eukprot:SAG22_NODE_4932_length_1122_cov_1.158406_2_plen_70_part_00
MCVCVCILYMGQMVNSATPGWQKARLKIRTRAPAAAPGAAFQLAAQAAATNETCNFTFTTGPGGTLVLG